MLGWLRRNGVLVSLGIVAIAFSLLAASAYTYPKYGEICYRSERTSQKECSSYSLPLFLFIKVFDSLNVYGTAITALATAVIAGFTGTLWFSTNRLWEASERQFQLEGPFLHPTVTYSGDIFKPRPSGAPGPFPVYAVVDYKIQNAGRSPAFPVSIADRLEHLTSMPSIHIADFSARYEVDHVIDAGETGNRTYTCRTEINISNDARDSITNGKSFLFLYGEIDFSDLIDNRYIQTFCLVYRPKERIFIRHGPAGYNKRRKKDE
jgi:hypothetical protein